MPPDFGFNYPDDARSREFTLAEKYFAEHPDQVKISRKLWKKLYSQDPPKHSYLRATDGKVFAIAHGEGSEIAQGGQGRVKYAMDKAGIKYALKISKSRDKDQLNLEESITQDVGILHGNKITRKDKTKSYTIQRYLGEDLNVYCQRENLTLADKFSIARKIAWELHKLHTGQSSSNGSSYAHLDLKVENIVIAKNGRIRLIDYGMAEEISSTTSVKHRGTVSQLPMSTSDFNALVEASKNKLSFRARNKVKEIRKRVEGNMAKLGRVGCDIFALKRTFYNPIIMKKKTPAAIFSKEEYERFSSFQRVIASDSENTISYTRDQLNTQTLFSITFALIQMQMHEHKCKVYYGAKEDICKCFALLDEVNECGEDKPYLSANELLTWQVKIFTSEPSKFAILQKDLISLKEKAACEVLLSNMEKQTMNGQRILTTDMINHYKNTGTSNSYTERHKQLINLNQCLSLLDKINLYAVGDNDIEMNQFTNDMLEKLQKACRAGLTEPDLQAIKNTLQKALTSVLSDEMHAVREQMDRLFTNAKNFFTWDKKGMLQKAEGIEKALQAVPVMERLNVFTAPESLQCHAVRKALASNRLTNRGKEIIPKNQIDNDKAANAFKLLKTRFTAMVERGQPAPIAAGIECNNVALQKSKI